MCDSDWMAHHECINSYIHSFRDITEQLLPAISEAFGVSFMQHEGGYTERKLKPSHWGWLFPQLLDDEKTAEQS